MKKNATSVQRGRPRAFDEDHALDAAMRVFANKGYEAASLSDLTAAMGINRFSMYATFGNKEALFVRAMERYTQLSNAGLSACLASGTAREGIEKILRDGVVMVTQPDSPGVCFITQAPLNGLHASHEARLLVARKRADLEMALRRRFDRAEKDGELPRGASPENLARYYSVMIQGLALQAQHGGTKEQLDAVVDVAMDKWPEVPSN
jgi:AcrR family transcriptional regulator